jgi:hypothetical protein
MKLRHIFSILFVGLVLLTGCNDDEAYTLLDEIQVSQSYISLPEEGGSTTISLTAKADWQLQHVPNWLSVSTSSGSAGTQDVTFSAEETLDGRTCDTMTVVCGDAVQHIYVVQGEAKISTATCAQVIAGPDGKTFQVTGVVSSISNTTYGNWYLTDNTGTIYIYGTLDAEGKEKNFSSLGLEVGDEVTVSGPKTTFNGTVELVNVTVSAINKSLIKVDSLSADTIAKDGGEITAYVTCKGNGVNVTIPEDVKSWLSISSIKQSGTSAEVVLAAQPNEGGLRKASLTFTTSDGTKSYSSATSLVQLGAIANTTVKAFNDAAVGDALYRLSGMVSDLDSKGFNLTDYSGSTYVYKLKDLASLNLNDGDIVTIVGQRGEYKGNAQAVNAYSEKVVNVKDLSIAEILKLSDNTDQYYRVTGTIKEIKYPTYGNMDLEADGSTIYVYGVYSGYGATGDARKGLVEAKGLKVGDKITICGYKTSYNGSPQLGGSFFLSKEE